MFKKLASLKDQRILKIPGIPDSYLILGYTHRYLIVVHVRFQIILML